MLPGLSAVRTVRVTSACGGYQFQAELPVFHLL
jgi:hypothetical protein